MVTVWDAEPAAADAVMAAHVAAIEARGPAAYPDEQVAAWAERPGGRPLPRARRRPRRRGRRRRAGRRRGRVRSPRAPGRRDERAAPEQQTDEGSLGPEAGEVRAVYVHGDHARSGVGSALLDHLEAVARERGLQGLELTASQNAVGFYERHGYEQVEAAVHETTGGVELAVVVMRKRLADGSLAARDADGRRTPE